MEEVADFNDEPIRIWIEETTTGFRIQSSGHVNTNTGTMTDVINLIFEREPTDASPFNTAVFAIGQGTAQNPAIELQGSAEIHGPVGTNSTGVDSVKFGSSTSIRTGDLWVGPNGTMEQIIHTPRLPELHVPDGTIGVLSEEQVYPDPIFPSLPTDLTERGNFSTPWVSGLYYEIADDGWYDTIEVTASRTLTIDLQGGTRRIRVRDLNIVQGHIELINKGENGRLELYVEERFHLSGSSTMNLGGHFRDVTVYYQGSNALNYTGNTRLVGSMHLKQANLSVSGSNSIDGHIISNSTGSITFGGSAHLQAVAVYAPKAFVTVGGSAQINGSVIANRVLVSGNARIAFETPDSGTVPGNSFPPGWLDGKGQQGQGQNNRRWTWK
mgnify:CR=1 FL=1